MLALAREKQPDRDVLARRGGADVSVEDLVVAEHGRVGIGSALQIFTVTAEGISGDSVFQDSEVFASFGLAAGLDAQGRPVGLTIHRGITATGQQPTAIALLASGVGQRHRP